MNRVSAQDIAERVRDDCTRASIEPGALIGRAEDLCRRYDVDIAILRQAARLLETRGFATMKRGPSGGLYRADSTDAALFSHVAISWLTKRTPFEAVAPALNAINSEKLASASARMTVPDAVRIRNLHENCKAACDPIERSHYAAAREDAIAGVTGNPLFKLSTGVITRYTREMVPFEYLAIHGDLAALIDEKIEALISGDYVTAISRARQYLDHTLRAWRDWEANPAEEHGAYPQIAQQSRPTWAAREVLRTIHSLEPGAHFLGTEADFMQSLGVSRGTWRQALRILQDYGVVDSRRGPSGGIYTSPDASGAVAGSVSDWLGERTCPADQTRSLLTSVAAESLPRALSQARAASPDRDRSTPPITDLRGLLHWIATLSGCPLLALFSDPRIAAKIGLDRELPCADPAARFLEWLQMDVAIGRRSLLALLSESWNRGRSAG